MGGLFVRSAAVLDRGTPLMVQVVRPGLRRAIQVTGHVVSVGVAVAVAFYAKAILVMRVPEARQIDALIRSRPRPAACAELSRRGCNSRRTGGLIRRRSAVRLRRGARRTGSEHTAMVGRATGRESRS